MLYAMIGGICALCLLFVGWSIYLFLKIEARFSGRFWDVPSHFYSDNIILYPGQKIDQEQLEKMLLRLQYRAVSTSPGNQGEYRSGKNLIEVYLRSPDPRHEEGGFPVNISFLDHTLKSITHRVTKGELPYVELEPEEIAQYLGLEGKRRQPVPLRKISRHVINAVLAAEDRHFYEHPGIDIMGVIRAAITNILHGSFRQGGSTITQQLVKNCLLSREKSLSRKLAEAIMALIIEQRYAKDEILELYLNEIYLGQKGSMSICGIAEAAQYYFGKHPQNLSLAESALIAGLIKAPNTYSPFISPERCRARRDAVLQAMRECGFISEEEMKEALKSDIAVVKQNTVHNKAPYFFDYVYAQLQNHYSAEALKSMGLSFYTTLDTSIQAAAEEALEEGLKSLEEHHTALHTDVPKQQLQGAVLVMDPRDGAIRAMVGGRSFGESQYNRITQARRQPGSAFKPFVVASALDYITPASLLSNKKRVYMINGRRWAPRNHEQVDDEALTVRAAIARSVNLCMVDLAFRIGMPRIINTARLFGFSTPLPQYPSLAIGASEVIPLELARAYCVFASGGVLPEAYALKKAVDQDGRVILRHHRKGRRILSPEKAFIMNSLLRSVVTEGTARNLIDYGITFPVAGKTGTTNDCRDAWFVGYTPELLCLVWIGFDDNRPTAYTGATAAVPIFARFMKAVSYSISGRWYSRPDGIAEIELCPASGKLAGPECPARITEVFLAGMAPQERCSLHHADGTLSTILRGIKKLWGR